MRRVRFIPMLLMMVAMALLLFVAGPRMLSHVDAQDNTPKEPAVAPAPPGSGGPRVPGAGADRGDGRREDGPPRSWREGRGGDWGDRFGRRGSGSYAPSQPFPAPFAKEEEAIAEGIRIFHLMQSPEFKEKFDQALKENPERIHEIIKRSWSRVQMLLESEREDKKLFELRMDEMRDSGRVRVLTFRLREAKKNNDAAAVASLTSDLKSAVTQRFDTRMKVREYELTELEGRIAKIKTEVDDMRKNRTTHIDQAFERALAAPTGGPGGPGPGGPGAHRDGASAEADKR